jgi:RNA polymerase sporulation-specific sigma factor
MIKEELIARAKSGDRDAGEQLIEENSGLIWSIVRRFLGRGTEADDLYQLGCLGFMKAVEGFDPAFGTQFSTYAVPKIAGEIRRFLRDDGAVKVSRSIKEQAAVIKATRTALSSALGREPTLQEIAQETGLTSEQIALAENATAATESIHRQTGEDGFSLEHILTDTESEEIMVERIALREAIDSLPEKERMTILLRYYRGFTQAQTARVLQVSQVQISRLEKKGLLRLREQFGE